MKSSRACPRFHHTISVTFSSLQVSQLPNIEPFPFQPNCVVKYKPLHSTNWTQSQHTQFLLLQNYRKYIDFIMQYEAHFKSLETYLLRNDLPQNKSLSIHRALLLFGSLSLLNIFQILVSLGAERKFLPAITLRLLLLWNKQLYISHLWHPSKTSLKNLKKFCLHWGRLKPPFLLNQSKAYSFMKWWRANCNPHPSPHQY